MKDDLDEVDPRLQELILERRKCFNIVASHSKIGVIAAIVFGIASTWMFYVPSWWGKPAGITCVITGSIITLWCITTCITYDDKWASLKKEVGKFDD